MFRATHLLGLAALLASGTASASFLAFNEDDTHYFCRKEAATREGLKAYIDDVCRGPVTHFFMCVNGQRACFDSQTIDSAWKGLDKPTGHAANLKKLNEEGVDAIRFWCECCRAKKVSPWLSIRMNDVHCVDQPDHPYLSSFWRNHPELWRGGPKAEPGMARAFNYRFPEVRAYFLAFVKEVADRYDCADGIELDWLRFTEHLTPGKAREEAEFLTAFMREARGCVRAAAERRGRPLRLSVRVATTPESALGYGMDVAAWAKEGLVDLVIPHNYRYEPDFDLPLERWTALLKDANPSVKVLPGCDSSIKIEHVAPDRKMNLDEFCGWADVMWSRGAKGLYLFNLYENPPDCEVWNEILDHGLAEEYVANHRRRYPLTYLDTPGGRPSGRQLPCDVRSAKAFQIGIGRLPDAGTVSVFLAFDGPVPDGLRAGVTLNGVPAAACTDEPLDNWVNGYRSNMHSITWASHPKYRFELPYLKTSLRLAFPRTALVAGANRIGLPAAETASRLMALELEVDPKGDERK